MDVSNIPILKSLHFCTEKKSYALWKSDFGDWAYCWFKSSPVQQRGLTNLRDTVSTFICENSYCEILHNGRKWGLCWQIVKGPIATHCAILLLLGIHLFWAINYLIRRPLATGNVLQIFHLMSLYNRVQEYNIKHLVIRIKCLSSHLLYV